MDPLLRLVSILIVGMLGLLLLLFLCTPIETHRRNFDKTKREMRDVIGPHALFFKWNAGIAMGLYLLGRMCIFLGDRLEAPRVTAFGKNSEFFALLACIAFLCVLTAKANAHHNQRVGEALFGPRTFMKTDIGAINNYGGNVAAGNSGPVHQHAHVDAMVLHQRIHSFVEKVQAESGYDGNRKREALTELNTLADQAVRPAAQREESKIKAALKLLPGLLSSASTLAQEWDKLEPWIGSHFGNG